MSRNKHRKAQTSVVLAEKADVNRFTAEIGRTGLRYRDGTVLEEMDTDLQGQKGIAVYEEMRRSDPAVATGIRAITWILSRVPWRVIPGGESAQDITAAELVDTARNDMSYPWNKLIRDAVTCLPFGWAYCEMVYKLRQGQMPADGNAATSQYDDGMIGWRKVVLIAQTTLSKWEIDDTGGILGLHQTIPLPGGGTKTVFIPIEKALLFRLDDERNNPEGVSLLRPVYGAWWAKRQMQEIEAIGIERDLTGVLIIYLPAEATAADHAKALTLLQQFKVNDMSGFTAPQFGPGPHQQWRFEIINSPGSKSIDVDSVINRYAHEISRTFLVQFLMLGYGQSGSFALSRDQRDMFQVALESMLDNLADTINRFMIPPLMLLNGFDKLTAYPKLVPGRIAKADMLKFSQSLSSLVTGKLINLQKEDEDFIREELDLPSLPADFEWKTPEERNIENIVTMQQEVGQVADASGRVALPQGGSPTNPPAKEKKPKTPGSGRNITKKKPA